MWPFLLAIPQDEEKGSSLAITLPYFLDTSAKKGKESIVVCSTIIITLRLYNNNIINVIFNVIFQPKCYARCPQKRPAKLLECFASLRITVAVKYGKKGSGLEKAKNLYLFELF